MTVGKLRHVDVAPSGLRPGLLPIAVAVAFAAVNLRPAITSTAPVVDEIRELWRLGDGAVAALATIPVVALAAGCPLAVRVAARHGAHGGILLGLAMVTAGLACRPWHPVALLVGTGVAALGIAFVSALLPAVIAAYPVRAVGTLNAIQMVSLTGGAAAASGVSHPALRVLSGDPRLVLLVWAGPAIIGVLVWSRPWRDRVHAVMVESVRGVARTRLGWAVTGFFAAQALLFFTLVAWLPTVLRADGVGADAAGGLLSLMSLAGIPAAWLVPQLAGRLEHQRLLAPIAACGSVAGVVGIILGHGLLTTAAVALVGFAQSACFSLALSLVVLRSSEPAVAAALSGFAQSVGFLIGAVGPWAFGQVGSRTDNWSLALLTLLPVVVAEGWLGWVAGAGVLRVGPDESVTEG